MRNTTIGFIGTVRGIGRKIVHAVDDNRGVSVLMEHFARMAAYIAGASGDKHPGLFR